MKKPDKDFTFCIQNHLLLSVLNHAKHVQQINIKHKVIKKDVIIKDLQVENQRLRMKVNNLENKVMSLEINGNHSEQYGRRKN